ncbi:MAG: CIA30 family protein, partial [Bacteroidota bacterium]
MTQVIFSLALFCVLVGLPTEHHHLFTFDDSDQSLWYEINDGVMGGVSEGKVSRTQSGTLLFQGKLSLD